MANKPLTIDVADRSKPTGSQNKWSVLGNTSVFINDIITPDLGEKADVGTMVSGIPTAFARVDLFRSALDATSTNESQNGNRNLTGFYSELTSEWRGLIACIGLDYANIHASRINLEYHDGKDISETVNVYEPTGAFGNMLLERRDRWCEQTSSDNEKKVPFINVIKYMGKVVGATSPESIVFTSSSYQVENTEDKPWVDVHTHRFIDPLKSELDETSLATLYAYVNHLLDNIPAFEGSFPTRLDVNLGSIKSNLTRWLKEMEEYARNRSYGIHSGSIPPVDAGFGGPFEALLTYEDCLYGVEGQISETAGAKGAQAVNPKKLLLPQDAKIARIYLGSEFSKNPSKLAELPVFVLTAKKKGSDGEYAFFALPLSAQGLNIYGKAVGPLVGIAPEGTTVNSTLDAVFDPELQEDNLEVTLSIKTENGRVRRYIQQYTVGSSEGLRNKDILLWPNFVSVQWDQYYLYSELIHNGQMQAYRAFPFVGDPKDEYFRIITDDKKAPLTLAKNGEIVAHSATVKAELLVSSGNAVAENKYKYEIYKSDKPFKGVRLLSPEDKEGGYLIVNYSSDPSSNLPFNWGTNMRNLDPVTIGMDFGSTNTSVAFSTSTGTPEGLEFHNQRVSLLSTESNGNKGLRENKILFFQGPDKPLKSNAIHSVLTLHDTRRLRPLAGGESHETRMKQEVLGGFPSFVDNLPVETVTDEKIYLKYPNAGQIVQIHNMKWSETELDKSYKMAYLRSLLLHVYSELFVKGYVPTKLRWSYPSSMSSQLLGQYQLIWDFLAGLHPVIDPEGKYYPLAVSKAKGKFSMDEKSEFNNEFGGEFDSSGMGSFNASNDVSGDPFNQTQPGDNRSTAQFNDPYAGLNGGDPGWGGSNPYDQPQPSQSYSDAPSGFAGFENAKPKKPVRKIVDLKPDDPNRVVKYEAERLFESSSENSSLTEANSVANFLSTRFADKARILDICFDIGGSTTDISALYMLGVGKTMIKQNSIRFAAQRVSGATKYVKGFEKVLNQICEQFGLTVLGLNKGDKRYSPDTAPYYFGQIVDRLDDDQLPTFYKMIAANAPQLMSINLYVTGLLIYYAGQNALKLVEDIYHLADEETFPGTKVRPFIRVSFAGKGSRLMQWLLTINQSAAEKYYNELFLRGFGGKEMAQRVLGGWPKIEFPSIENSKDTKYEVSKGLAKSHTDLCNPKDDTPSEIIGESGFTLVSATGNIARIKSTNSITSEMIENIGTFFNPDEANPCWNFQDFCGVFMNTARQLFDMNISKEVFIEGFRNMNITQYIQNLPEFTAARNNKNKNGEFDFVAPVIILEGMKFYDDYLIKALK